MLGIGNHLHTCLNSYIFNLSEIDDSRSGARYEFSSYSELCSILPKGNIIANIPNSKEANISAYVECPEGTTDFADYNNYSYLDVDVFYDDSTSGFLALGFKFYFYTKIT